MNEQLKIIISAEVAKLKQNVESAKKQVEKFTEGAEKGASEMDKAFKEAGTSIGNGIKAGVAVGMAAITAISAALIGAAGATEEYRRNQALLTSAFETAGTSAEVAKGTYNDLYRVLGDDGQATEAAQHLAKLTDSQEGLSEWTTICQGVYATFGASLPIEGLTEAANETAKVGQVTGGLADALNWAGISEDAFNEKLAACNTEAEREKLIRETLNGVYQDAAANYEKNAAETIAQNEAQAKLTSTMAELGQAVAPIITEFKNFAADALAKVTPYIKDLGEKYMPKLKEVLSQAGEAVKAAFGFFIDNWEIFAAIAGVIAGIATAIGLYNAVAAIKAAMDAAQVTTIWALVSAHIAQAAAAMAAMAPYILIVAAIAAVIAIIVLCIKYWDDIVAAVKKAFKAIVEAIKAAVDWIKGIFDKVVAFFKDNWQALLLLLVNPFAGAFKLIYDNCEGFRKVVDNVCKAIKDFFANLWENIKNIFKGVGNWFKNTFNSAVSGIKNVFSSIGGFFKGIWESIKNIFSNVGATIGNAITNTVKKAINGVLSTAVKIINGFISGINFAIGIINAIPGVSIKKLTKLEVPQLAKGGIVDSATLAVVGERGKEAVVPLENNLEWLDKLADRLADKVGGNTPIKLYVDKKVLAEASVDGINDLTKQTGSLPLVFA